MYFIVVSNSFFSLGKPFLIKQMRDEDVLFHFSLYSLVFCTVPGIGEKDKEGEREE